MSTKLETEREFHNVVFSEGGRESAWKYHSAATRSLERYQELLAQQPVGHVLEYGCGINSDAIPLARRGCKVTGIDISDEAVRQSHELARQAELSERLTFHVMDGEALTFPDDSFDLVCGNAIIHHLDTDTAYAEIARVLRAGGHAIFIEPLGHNPIFNAYRRRTPNLRTPDEHPLRMPDLDLARRHFATARFEFFELAVFAAVPLRNSRFMGSATRVLQRVDRVLLSSQSPMRRWGWRVILDLSL